MTYKRTFTEAFYDDYGQREWLRLEPARPYGSLQSIIHCDFVHRYVKPGDKVLDAGSGPGRFASEMAKAGARVTLLDVSSKQLELARVTFQLNGIEDKAQGFVHGDICDLAKFPDGAFNVTVCFGGALSYVCEKRFQAAAELVRVTAPGGIILVSVMSLLGSALNILYAAKMLEDPQSTAFGKPGFFDVLSHGDLDLTDAPSKQPPMHLYRSDELKALFGECALVEAAGSNVTIRPHSPGLNEIAANAKAWATVVEFERRACTSPGMIECGDHLIMVFRRKVPAQHNPT